ncbi:hypothetical protein D9758_004523 [Tetrapyrgos nigripes]|uniref:Uncharacterized protein n=1 Tax=Tetrapyrgos nigripes TaxID=182062 RepID=A0A8H5H0I3_9AGAR|nr:hypothetical protein D9758_004523 [Tetrapyrgos nigripes]
MSCLLLSAGWRYESSFEPNFFWQSPLMRSIFTQAVAYGFLFCMFCLTLYFTFGGGRRSYDNHSRILLGISTTMFLIATLHACISVYRLVVGYSFNRLNPRGGPAGYLANLRHWDAIFSDLLYATQEILGGAAAIYRCWVLWGKNFNIIALPISLLIVSTVFGYGTDVLFARLKSPTASVPEQKQIQIWVRAFYVVAVVQNILTTGLMVYSIWRTYKKTAGIKMKTFGGMGLTWVMRTMIEAAGLQLLIEFLLLIFFLVQTNLQYIFLDLVVPVIGISFNAMTISYRLRLLTEGGRDVLSSWRPATTTAISSHHAGSDGTQTRVAVDVDVIELSEHDYTSQFTKGKGRKSLEV